MPCKQCGGMVVAEKEIINNSTKRVVLSMCLDCKQYYEITTFRDKTKLLPSTFCKDCNKIQPYEIFKELSNWGAYERGEEEAKEYEFKVCYICRGIIKEQNAMEKK